eukprot:Amastigsp_a683702_87.p2 type:complete len:163 gc:universal Amastigsp_a683702_87:123-611(+)
MMRRAATRHRRSCIVHSQHRPASHGTGASARVPSASLGPQTMAPRALQPDERPKQFRRRLAPRAHRSIGRSVQAHLRQLEKKCWVHTPGSRQRRRPISMGTPPGAATATPLRRSRYHRRCSQKLPAAPVAASDKPTTKLRDPTRPWPTSETSKIATSVLLQA